MFFGAFFCSKNLHCYLKMAEAAVVAPPPPHTGGNQPQYLFCLLLLLTSTSLSFQLHIFNLFPSALASCARAHARAFFLPLYR